MICQSCGKKLHRKETVYRENTTMRRFRCSGCGKSEYVNENDTVNADEIAEVIRKASLTPQEAKRVVSGLRSINHIKREPTYIDYPDRKIKILAFGDAHIGHNLYRPDVMEMAAEVAHKEKVDFILNTGDTLEGMSGRRGHIYELSHAGYSKQAKYFVREFEQFGSLAVYSIEANDSHTGWYKTVGDAGIEAGEDMELKSKQYKFLGWDEQDLILDSGLKIRLVHPGGGTAHAISWRPQQYINGLSGGKKPHLLFMGHFHKAEFLPQYRNIAAFQTGCMQEQTIFMKKQTKADAEIGFWVVEADYNKDNWCCSVKAEFFRFYE